MRVLTDNQQCPDLLHDAHSCQELSIHAKDVFTGSEYQALHYTMPVAQGQHFVIQGSCKSSWVTLCPDA